MANEMKWVTTTQATIASSGTSMATNAGPISAGTLATSNHSNFPRLDFVLNCSFSASHASGSSVHLYARPLDVDSTSDQDAPGASFLHKLIGAFLIPGFSTSAVHIVTFDNVPSSPIGPVEFYLDNKTNTPISAGWTLKCTPKTYVPGA